MLLLSLAGCISLLAGVDVGPTWQAGGQYPTAVVEANAGIGLAMASDISEATGFGGGVTGRFRTAGDGWTSGQIGTHVFGAQAWTDEAISWVRLGVLAGAVSVDTNLGPVSTLYVQPGHSVCDVVIPDFCVLLSVPVGYDVAGRDHAPGLTVGIQLGVGVTQVEVFDPF